MKPAKFTLITKASNGSVYMHTMDGKPAYYNGEQIVFVSKYARFNEMFVESLDKIKQQRNQSADWREKQGWDILVVKGKDKFVTMGYVRVKL